MNGEEYDKRVGEAVSYLVDKITEITNFTKAEDEIMEDLDEYIFDQADEILGEILYDMNEQCPVNVWLNSDVDWVVDDLYGMIRERIEVRLRNEIGRRYK